MLDPKNLVHRNGHWDSQNDSEDNRMGDVESDIQQDNGIEDPECRALPDMSFAQKVLRLIWPPQKSK
jgi:hypothetical protein